MCFLKNINFTKNLENCLQFIGTKECKLQIANLDSNPGTSCSMKSSEKQKGILSSYLFYNFENTILGQETGRQSR